MSKGLEALERLETFVNETIGIKHYKESGWHIQGSDDYTIIEKELKALEVIKELFDFDFAIRYGNNQPILRITNKLYEKLGKPFYYWELPITQEEYDLLKEVLL